MNLTIFYFCLILMVLFIVPYQFYVGKLKKSLVQKDLFFYLEFDRGATENNVNKSLKFFKFLYFKYRNDELSESELLILGKIRMCSITYSLIFLFLIFYFLYHAYW
jgi:predicted Holliday junction resolvase-like endonuclease